MSDQTHTILNISIEDNNSKTIFLLVLSILSKTTSFIHCFTNNTRDVLGTATLGFVAEVILLQLLQ